MNVPLWKLREQGRLVRNPEIDNLDPLMDPITRAVAKHGLSEAGGTYSIKDGLDSKYVRGARDYKGLDLAELGEYARKNKARFAGGALGTLGGLGLAGYGISRLLPKKKEKRG